MSMTLAELNVLDAAAFVASFGDVAEHWPLILHSHPRSADKVRAVAERLGITRAGVQHRIDAGLLPAVRVGNAWAIPAAALREE